VVAATAAQAKALGAPYQAGDQIGAGGIEQAYQAQLAGHTIGATFGRAAEFLKLAAADATSITDISAQARP